MRHILLVMLFLLSMTTQALSLRDDYPKRYVVKRGDTLWDIAGLYLHKPWEWKALLQANSHIKNPDKIYPGALLVLRFYHKKPYIQVVSNGTVVLSPHVRTLPPDDPIPAIQLIDILPFLDASLVMDKNRLRRAPYILAFKAEHMMAGQGDEVYVKNLHRCCMMPINGPIPYAIYRPGRAVYSPFRKGCLGYKAELVGYGELASGGDPAIVLITEMTDGIKLNDRVMYDDFEGFNLYFEPKEPPRSIHAAIIDIGDDFKQGAVGSVVLLDRGQDAGLEPGDVLAIYGAKRLVCQKRRACRRRSVALPRERVGELMIFRTFTKTSYGLVIRSIRSVQLKDRVTNP